MSSVLWRCWLVGRKGIRPVKTEWWVICLERGADLHMAQLMPLPLTVSCFSKIQIGFTFLVLAHPGSPRKKAVKRVYVQKGHRNCRIRVLVICHTKSETCEWRSPLALVSGFQPITRTDKWWWMFVQKSGNAQIIDVGDVKTAKMLFELLIAKKLVNLTIFRTINRLISRYFFRSPMRDVW